MGCRASPSWFGGALLVAMVAAGCDADLSRFDQVDVDVGAAPAPVQVEPDPESDAEGGSDADTGPVDEEETGGEPSSPTPSPTDPTPSPSPSPSPAPTPNPGPPTAPTTLKTTFGSAAGVDVRYASSTSIFFVWNAATGGASGIRDYTVEWFADGTCTVPAAGSQATLTVLNHPVAAVDGDVLSFKVTAFDGLGQSSTSACSGSITVDTQAPPDLTAFTGVAGTATQTVTLGLTFPGVTSDLARVDVRRIEAATFPDDCTSGRVVKSYSGAFPATDTVVDDTGGAARTFSYRVCLYDLAGNVTKVDTVAGVVTKPHLIFATSKLFNGNLVEVPPTLTPPSGGQVGIAKADYFCNLLGQTISSESWRAVLSDDEMDARTHIAVTGVIKDTSASPLVIANDATDLWDGSIDNQVYYDELGGNAIEVWTGSDVDGTRNVNNCVDWSSTVVGDAGVRGYADIPLDGDWLAASTATCNTTRSLYCISHPADDPFLAFSAVTGGASGEIDLALTPPASYGKVDRVKVFRLAGAVAPDTDCLSGTLVTQITSVSAASVSLTDTALAAGAYSYRICAVDIYGNPLTSATATNVLAN